MKHLIWFLVLSSITAYADSTCTCWNKLIDENGKVVWEEREKRISWKGNKEEARPCWNPKAIQVKITCKPDESVMGNKRAYLEKIRKTKENKNEP